MNGKTTRLLVDAITKICENKSVLARYSRFEWNNTLNFISSFKHDIFVWILNNNINFMLVNPTVGEVGAFYLSWLCVPNHFVNLKGISFFNNKREHVFRLKFRYGFLPELFEFLITQLNVVFDSKSVDVFFIWKKILNITLNVQFNLWFRACI